MAKKINFKKIDKRFNGLKSTLPRLAANKMLNHSKKAFRDEGFTDKALVKWKARKRLTPADRRTGRRRAILVQSGALRRSLRKKTVTFASIRVGSYGIAYASRHNRGLAGMPQRKFVGTSQKLTKDLTKLVRTEFRKALRA